MTRCTGHDINCNCDGSCVPARRRNRLPGLDNLWHFAMLVGMIMIFYFMMALSVQRSNEAMVALWATPESAMDLASVF